MPRHTVVGRYLQMLDFIAPWNVDKQLSENFGIFQQTALFFEKLKGFLKNNPSALLTCYWAAKPRAKTCNSAVSYQKQTLGILASIVKTKQRKDERTLEERTKSSSAMSYQKQKLGILACIKRPKQQEDERILKKEQKVLAPCHTRHRAGKY